MKTNTARQKVVNRTAGGQGGIASVITPEQTLERLVLTNLLWENNAYESGVLISQRIKELIPQCSQYFVKNLAIRAKKVMKLRHVPLFLCKELSRSKIDADTLNEVIVRPDEMGEFLAMYWSDQPNAPIPNQVKKGLAKAFAKFDEYQFAKWNKGGNGRISLRDVMMLVHPKPDSQERALLYKKILENRLDTPNTWESRLTAGEDKKSVYTDLIETNKMPAQATLMNLRNFIESGVDRNLILKAISDTSKSDRLLPFQYLRASKYAQSYIPALESAMIAALGNLEKLPGTTVVILDVSGSMNCLMSNKSELTRLDTSTALLMLLREVCEDPIFYLTAGGSQIHQTTKIPVGRGFSINTEVKRLQNSLGGGGIFLAQCLTHVNKEITSADRVIVITDEQDCDTKLNPANAPVFGKHNYIINIAAHTFGIAYNKYLHINGFSEGVIKYISALENL